MAIHILTNVTRRKGYQAIKFGQLIEYNRGNILLENIHKMWWRNYSQTLF